MNPFWKHSVSLLPSVQCVFRLTIVDFLDHLLREYPSTKFLALRRSFFNEKGDFKDLGNGVLAFKGVYQAIRPAIVSFLVLDIVFH